MTVQQLQYFKALAETLNFSKVAVELHVSQPNLSHSINSLEQELGVQLFNRQKGRKTELTQDGQVFYHYVKNSIEILDKGVQAVQSSEVNRQKFIRIAYSHVYGLVVVPTVVREMKRSCLPDVPTVQFSVVQTKTDFAKMVMDNEVDAAFSFSQGNASVGAIPLQPISLKVIISGSHPLRSKDVITIEDIANEPLICCEQEMFLHRHVLDIFRSHGIRPNIKEVFPDWGPQFANVSYNAGVAITPSIPMATDMIVTKELVDPLNFLMYNLLYRTTGQNSKLVKKLQQAAIRYSELGDDGTE